MTDRILQRYTRSDRDADSVVDDAAVRADRAVLPQHSFDMGEGGGFVVHVGGGQHGHGRGSLTCLNLDIFI